MNNYLNLKIIIKKVKLREKVYTKEVIDVFKIFSAYLQ